MNNNLEGPMNLEQPEKKLIKGETVSWKVTSGTGGDEKTGKLEMTNTSIGSGVIISEQPYLNDAHRMVVDIKVDHETTVAVPVEFVTTL